MSVILRPTTMKVRNDGETEFQGFNVVADQTVAETIASIPKNYTALNNKVDELEGEVDTLNSGGLIMKDSVIATNVKDWLDEHPEATTSVQDGSLTESKFTDSLKLKTIKDYVTPEMFGAVGDGISDDYNAITEALATGKTVVLGEKIYYSSRSIVLSRNYQIQGISRKNSILKFAEDINGIQLNHSNSISNFTISFSGNGSGLYLYTPDNYSFSLSTIANNLTIVHDSDDIIGSFIRLIAQKISDKPYGAYNLLFSNIDCRNKAKYGIEIVNKVATTSNTECWFTELKFDSIFFDKVETVLYSDWEDISGINAVPSTGQASRNGSIKLINVSVQYTSGVSKNYAIVRNIRNLELIGCNPFDYYILANQQNNPIFIFNATSNMCVVNFSWMYEFADFPALKSSPYIAFENSSDYDSDFEKIVTYLEIGNGKIYGNFIPYNGVMKSDFKKSTEMTPVTSPYGTARYGYIQIGDIVIISISIIPSTTVTFPANTQLLNELLPIPFSGRSACPITAFDGSNSVGAYIRYNGEMRLTQAITTANVISFSGIYIS